MVGYHFLPGGIWSGDYLVAELDALLHNIDDAPYPQGKVRVHRVKEVCKYLAAPTYPFAVKRESVRLDIKSSDVVIGDLGKIPDHDPVAEYLDFRPEEDGLVTGENGTEEPGDAHPPRPADKRGEADILPEGSVRKYAGSTRPPGISSAQWTLSSPKKKEDAVEEYERAL